MQVRDPVALFTRHTVTGMAWPSLTIAVLLSMPHWSNVLFTNLQTRWVITWLYQGYHRIISGWSHDHTMVITWSWHGYHMTPYRGNHMTIIRWSRDHIEVIKHIIYQSTSRMGDHMTIPGSSYTHTMVITWSYRGDRMATSWGDHMTIIRWSHDHIKVIAWLYRGNRRGHTNMVYIWSKNILGLCISP